jgi:type II secretory ATPase GspE/PulE/Tfp pilus assembly ATPase PilB-like protein
MRPAKITGEFQVPKPIADDIDKTVKTIPDFKKKIEENLKKKTTELMEIILAGAIKLKASDIHVEPEEEEVKLRIRLDGILQDVLFLDNKIYKALVSRIKLLARLKLNVSDRPQDGRFSILFKESAIEIRASSLPAEYGESIVMRVLDPQNLINVESLGLRDDMVKIFNKEIDQPNGMIIITGPTGSGKTTTLYAILKELNKPEVKIITIEDPIEYHLEGISQTQVDHKKGYDFASGLRSIMRQDPDVVLVGEIRDLETAQIALQAAMTGHLVLSTLHTNDAAGTIARLQALGESPINISPAINIAIGQRLVRKVCEKCKRTEAATDPEIKQIKDALKGLKIKIPEIKSDIKIVRAVGCKECNNAGYKGRIGIFEFFLIDDEMEKFILRAPSIVEMKEEAIKKGMVTMQQDGFIKVLEGKTTLEEIKRVMGE